MIFMHRKLFDFILSEKSVLWFVWSTLVVAGTFSIYRSQWSTLFVILLTLFFTFIPTLLHRWYDIKLPRLITLLGVLFAYASLFLGEIHDFYQIFHWWDIALHGSSAMIFGLIGLGAMRMMQSARTIDANASVVAVFGFTFAVAIGALWEIIEFILDMIFNLTMQVSLQDTMGDLIVDCIGAFVVSSLGYIQWKYGRTNLIGETIEHFIKRYQNREDKS